MWNRLTRDGRKAMRVMGAEMKNKPVQSITENSFEFMRKLASFFERMQKDPSVAAFMKEQMDKAKKDCPNPTKEDAEKLIAVIQLKFFKKFRSELVKEFGPEMAKQVVASVQAKAA